MGKINLVIIDNGLLRKNQFLFTKHTEKAVEKKKAEKEAAEERIEKAKVSTSESGEVSDEGEAVSTEGTVLDDASIDIVSSGITVSTGAVSEPVGKNVDVKV